jgi:uncharacterized protein (DUF433 family)
MSAILLAHRLTRFEVHRLTEPLRALTSAWAFRILQTRRASDHWALPGTEEPAMEDQVWERITVDPKVMAGKPVIRGTRIPVELIVRMLAQGIPEADILREYPRLQPQDIRAALTYAARSLADEDVLPLSASA